MSILLDIPSISVESESPSHRELSVVHERDAKRIIKATNALRRAPSPSAFGDKAYH